MDKNLSKEKNMKHGIWDNEEVKTLFYEVEKVKEENKPLKIAFESHAKKFARKPNSVRNYYYHEIDNLERDKERLKAIGVNLENHRKSEIKYFSQDEEKRLMNQIDEQVKKGMSVRKVCLNLSGGDIELMLRYQNKYRNYILKNSKTKDDTSNNVVRFTSRRLGISDDEIKALFMGIVRLVKRSAAEEISAQSKKEISSVQNELRNVLSQLGTKENELEKLKKEFLKIKEENEILSNNIMKIRSEKTEKLRRKIEEKATRKREYI